MSIDNTAQSPHAIALSGTGTEGYFLAGAHGQVGNFGDAVYHGDATGFNLSAPMISLATTSTGGILAACAGRRHLQLRQREVLRFDRRNAPQQTDRRAVPDPDWQGLLACR